MAIAQVPGVAPNRSVTAFTLLACASIVLAQDADIRKTEPKVIFDEIVVVGTKGCGSWPIEHDRIWGCVYAELEREDLPMVLQARRKFLSGCLDCVDSQCTMKTWEKDQVSEKQFCTRTFMTPVRVPRFVNPDFRSSPFWATYTYGISTTGRVRDIEIVSFGGDVDEDELLSLIEGGAARVRFEPIVVDGSAYELVGLRDSYILDDSR